MRNPQTFSQSRITRFIIWDLLERKASEAERKHGLDLADYLIRFNHKEFVFAESDDVAIIIEF